MNYIKNFYAYLIFGKKVKYEGDFSWVPFNNPSFDYVPPNLITIFATNIGIIIVYIYIDYLLRSTIKNIMKYRALILFIHKFIIK